MLGKKRKKSSAKNYLSFVHDTTSLVSFPSISELTEDVFLIINGRGTPTETRSWELSNRSIRIFFYFLLLEIHVDVWDRV